MTTDTNAKSGAAAEGALNLLTCSHMNSLGI
jgi:hypothetical protein